MKPLIVIASGALLLAGCGGNNEAPAPPEAPAKPASHANAASHGTFHGTVGDNSYEVDVDCFHLDKDWFTFLSDQNDMTDSNGDGLNISGMQNGDKFVLTVTDHGQTYSTGRLESFSKNATGARGSGSLMLEGSPDRFDAEFSVTCN